MNALVCRGVRGFLLLTAWAYLFHLTHANRLDDFLITARYGYNLAHGAGLCYNPGEAERVQGYTSPLYPFLFALVEVFLHLEDNLPVFGPFLGCVSLMFMAWLLTTWIDPACRIAVLLLTLLFFLTSQFFWQIVGFEGLAAAALGMTAIELYQRNQLPACAGVLALAVLMRPDSILLGLVIGAHWLWIERRLPPARPMLILGLILLPWFVFAMTYYGTVLPNTLFAKIEQGRQTYAGHQVSLAKALKDTMAWYPNGLLWPFAVAGAGLLTLRRTTRLRLLVVWGIFHFVAYFVVLRVPSTYSWYLTVPVTAMYALALLLLVRAFECFARLVCDPVPSWQRFALAVVCGGLLLVPATLLAQHEHQRRVYLVNPARHRYELYREAARFFRDRTPPETTIACGEIGVIGYYSRRTIRDLGNLVNHNVKPETLDADYYLYVVDPEAPVPAAIQARYEYATGLMDKLERKLYIYRRVR